MKIFISWSGELSHKVAKDLQEWFSYVLQGVDSFVSSEDIRKGQRWALEVAKELDKSNFGIICLTKDNLNAPWILFEAGALSKSVQESNLSALLINDIQMADITGPLSQFQHTTTSKEDFQKLVTTINEKLGEKRLQDETLKKVFEKWWPDIETKLRLNIESTKGKVSNFEQRSEREILVETLELTRILANQSLNRLDFQNIFNSMVLKTDDGILLSPNGGDYNHPSKVSIYPVLIKEGGQEKLVSVSVSNGKVEIAKIDRPSHTRGVIVVITFFSETENQYWEAKFEFHEGNTLFETRMIDTKVVDPLSDEITIWRD